MRLTLRTLLAYLDDILDPEDAKLLQRKIEDSEFATSLVHQVRGSVRRLQLAAPALDAQGIGGDLNSVAEYLDNVLPPEQVPSLEKACLESEVNLGEVASCHQILTLVLGKPADIDDVMRQRAYAIAPTTEPGPLPPTMRYEPHDAHEDVVPPASFRRPPSDGVVSPQNESPTPNVDIQESVSPESDSPESSPAEVSDTTKKQKSNSFASVPLPQDLPSTKETWRAEAVEVAEVVEATPNEMATPVAASDSRSRQEQRSENVLAPPAYREDYPEYMDRKGSWLRSAFVTGLVALLLLAGLLFAMAPSQGSYLSGWFNGGQKVADANLVPLNDATVPPSETAASPQMSTLNGNLDQGQDVVERQGLTAPGFAAQPTTDRADGSSEVPRWVDPPSLPGDEFAPPTAQQSTAGDLGNGPIPPPRFSATQAEQETSAAQPIPELVQSEVFEPAEADPQLGQDAEEPVDSLPTVEPESNVVARDPNSTKPNTGPLDEVTSEPKVDTPIASNIIPRDESTDMLPEVPRAPANIDRVASRSENQVRTDPTAPIVDPGIDDPNRSSLEEIPVASPVSSVAADVRSASRLPIETRAPDPEITRTLGPTKLRLGSQLLLAYDASIEEWKRVDSTVPLNAGSFIQSLPAFRADVEIGDNITCTLVDSTRLQLGPEDSVSLRDGKLLVRYDKANTMQDIRFQNEVFEVGSALEKGVIAIDASHVHVPGSDLAEIPHSILKIHAVNGGANVSVRGRKYEVKEQEHLLVFDGYLPLVVSTDELPLWTTKPSVSGADASAVRVWKKSIGNVDSVVLWLREQSKNDSYNRRALAARCLAELDDYSGIVAAIADPEQRAYWGKHFETLRRASARGSDSVAKLQLELEKAHGERAQLLLELIRGYSKEQLGGGAAQKLVELLSHPELDYRVLAYLNLRAITGATQDYEPQKTRRQLGQSIRRWERRLSQNSIKYKETPEVVQLLQHFAKQKPAGSDG